MRKNKRVMMTVLLCASLALTGCSTTTTKQKSKIKTEEANKEQTVKLTLWGGAEDQKMLQSMVDDFKKEYASEASFDIKLAVESETTCKETLLGDVQKGADVFAFPDDQLQALAASGVLQEIEDADQVKQDNIKGAVDAASINERLFAYPMTADNGYFLYYNSNFAH